MTTLLTTADEVLERFNMTDTARRKYHVWSNGRRRHTVMPLVLAHRTDALYAVTVEDIARLQDPKKHALGNIKRAEGERVKGIVDWSPDFAFTHVFHYTLEKLGHLPDWLEFRKFCEDDATARQALWVPAQRKIDEEAKFHGRETASKSMRWRIGKAFYSFVREVHLIACLHARGIDVRVHPLADALFRVDAWWDDTVLSLYIGNAFSRNGNRGRKDLPEEILAGSPQPLRFETVKLKPADKFGVVHLARQEDIDRVAERLHAARRAHELHPVRAPSETCSSGLRQG